jgi:hypothetical protein
VLALVGVLTTINTAIRDLDRSAAAHLHEHPDGAIFTSFPRVGRVNAAQIRAELAEPDAYTGPEAIAALAGLVPVTRASGKHRAVSFRWACNKRLRVAITTFADNSRHASPGPPRSTDTPAPAGRTTPTPCASWPAPGSASSGDAGSIKNATTPAATATLPRPSRHPQQHDVDLEG